MNGGFLGLPKRRTDPRTSRFVVLPGGYEETTTYVKGTAKGRFEPVLLPSDPSSGDFGAGMLEDEGKKDLVGRLVAWFKETLPLPEPKP